MSSRRSSRRVASSRVASETRVTLPWLARPTTDLQWDEVKPLSGKPFFHTMLSPSHLNPRFHMGVPNNMCLKLPSSNSVTTILTHRGKSWDLVYIGNGKPNVFGVKGWRKFAVDNCLRLGDACIFELMECSDKKIIFEVQILRGDIPSNYFEGQSPEVPIVIN